MAAHLIATFTWDAAVISCAFVMDDKIIGSEIVAQGLSNFTERCPETGFGETGPPLSPRGE